MPTDPKMIQYSTAAAPNNPTDAHLAIGSTARSATDAIDQSQSLAGSGAATSQMAYMQDLSDEEQRLAWNSATSAQQSLLAGVGYKPPKAAGRGWFSRGWHDVLGAPAAAYHGKYGITKVPVLGTAAKGLVNTAANAVKVLAAPNELAKHVYRAGAYDNETNDPDNPIRKAPVIGGANNFLVGTLDSMEAGLHYVGNVIHLDTPSEWADAWHATEHGDQTFDPNKQRDIQVESGFDDTTFQLAKAVAGNNKDVTEFLSTQIKGGMSNEDVVALEAKTKDKNFQDTVTKLKDAKLSFGRSLVPNWMWENAHPAGTFVSGTGDAAFSFVDPTIVGGKISKANKVAKYGFKSLEELDEAVQTPGFRAWADDVVTTLNKTDKDGNINVNGLIDRFPELIKIAPQLAQAGPKNADDIIKLARPGDTTAVKDAAAAQKRAELAVDDVVDTTKSQHIMKKAIKDAGLAEVKTQEAFADWAIGNFLSMHIFSGNATAISHGVNLVPSLNKAGKAFLDTKQSLRKAIHWGADHGVEVGENGITDASGAVAGGTIKLLGTTAKRLVDLIPEGGPFSPNDPNVLLKLKRFASAYLPDQAVAAFVRDFALAPNLTEKRQVYTEMYTQTLRAAGADISDDSPLMKHMISNTNTAAGHHYGSNGIDKMAMRDGKVAAQGFSEKHMTEMWYLPDMKILMANAERGRFNKMVYGISNNSLANSFSVIWKPMQLMRMGFPVRVAIEEIAGGTARNGPWRMAQAALASRAIRGINKSTFTEDAEGKLVRTTERDGYGQVGPLADLDPFATAFVRGMRMLPERIRPSIDTANKLQANILAHRTSRLVRYTAGKMPTISEYVKTAEKFKKTYQHTFTSEASSVETARHGFVNDEADGLIGDFGDNMRKVKVEGVAGTGKYMEFQQGDDYFMSNWMKHLDDIGGSGLMRTVLDNHKLIESDPKELERIVADYIESPGFKEYRDAAYRRDNLRDGRRVGYDATEREASEDWAQVVIQHVDDMLPTGEHRDALVKELLDSKTSPDSRALRNIPAEFRPEKVSGQEFAELPTGGVMGLFGEFVDRQFHRLGTAIDIWSRQPLHLAAAHKADKELAPIVHELFGDSDFADELLESLVMKRVNNEVLPFVHDPKVRSQMNVLTQNLAPFQFAEEQFWKRWAKTFVHSPEALREAQLAHHALGATGITHTDSSGEEIFTYPLSGFAQQVVSKGLNAVGIPASLPVKQAFTGQLKMVAPGLEDTFKPSFGPLVSIPLNQLAQKFPELRPAQHAMLGDIGTNRPVLDQIFPSTIIRLLRIGDDDRTSTQYANAEMRAIQDLYAAKDKDGKSLGLDQNASPEETEQFMARVKNWTRINMALRAAIGFGAPAAPSSEIGDTKVAQELRTLTDSGMDFTAAMQELVRRDPDAFPYTVFQSAGTGSATLPATEASAAMLDEHQGFFKNHKSAGGFFLPTKAKDDAFNNEAYQEQLMAGLRQRKTPQEFLNNIMYSQAAADYYDTRDAYNLDVKDLHGAARDQAANAFQQWKAQYFLEHPVFAAEIQSTDSRLKRATTVEDLKRALNDDTAPRKNSDGTVNQQVQQIEDLVDTYSEYQSQMAQLAGMGSARATKQRQSEKAAFADWARNYTKEHPGALDVYNRLIRPDVDAEGENLTIGA